MDGRKTNFPHVEKSGKRLGINVEGIFLSGVNEILAREYFGWFLT